MSNRNWLLYVHIFPNKKRYYGITGRTVEQRWGYKGVGYKEQIVGYAIKKYGWDNIQHKILLKNLTREEAEYYEKKFIAKYNSMLPFGYNVESGGNLGKTVSKEMFEFLSKVHKGKTLGNKNGISKSVEQYDLRGNFIKYWECMADATDYMTNGRTRDSSQIVACCDWSKSKHHYTAYGFMWIRPSNFADEADKKIEIQRRARYFNDGYKIRGVSSPKVALKDYSNIHTSKGGNKGNTNTTAKEIDQFNKNGEFIKRHLSCREAQKAVDSKTQISAFNGSLRKGCIWLFPEDFASYEEELERVESILAELQSKIAQNNSKVSVLLYDMEGNFVEEFNSVKEASKSTGIARTTITACLRGQTQHNKDGSTWKYKDKEVPHKRNFPKEILQYDRHNNFVQKFSSLKEAYEATGIDKSSIIRCCTNRNKTAGGYIWKYT